MRHVVAFILLSLTALPAAVRAQQQAPLTFNAPYACPDGLTLVVQRCETRGRGEICLYERHRAGALLDRANSTRDQLSRRLQSCQLAQAVEPGSGQAMNPPYLSQMPPVERVMREVRGADALDTAARQAGVLWQLRGVISEMALRQGRNDRQWTLDERRLFNQYHAAYYQAWQPVEQALAGNRPRLFELQGYTATRDLLYEALDRLAAPGFAAEFRKARGEIDARIQARKEADRRQMEAAQAEQQRALAELQASRQPRPWQRDLARCIAAGRSESQCLTEGLGKGFVEIAPIAKNRSRTPPGPSCSSSSPTERWLVRGRSS